MDQDRSARRGGRAARRPRNRAARQEGRRELHPRQEEGAKRARAEARYTGTDDKGQLFTIIAGRAVQPSSDTPIVDINDMYARLNLQQGPLVIAAGQGRYNLDTQQVAVIGPINVQGADGWHLRTEDVTVDLKQRKLASHGPAVGQMRLGQFRANQIRADLGTHTVVLDGGARLKITQGAVR